MNTTETKHRRKFRRTISLIPTVFTVGNLFFGFYAIISVMNGNYEQAARAIGFAVVLDMLDGRIARLTNSTSEMGLQLDSLADVISFCLAPAILINFWAFQNIPPFGWITGFIFLICGTMRLARFNIMVPDHQSFVGMPTPAGGGMIAALVHFMKTPDGSPTTLVLMLAMVYALSFLMISTIRYPGFKNLQLTRGRSSINILFLAISVASIYFYSEIVLMVLASVYASSGVLSKLFSLVRYRSAPGVKVPHPIEKR